MRQYFRIIAELPFAIKWLLLTELLYGLAIGIWGVNLNFHLREKHFSDIGIGSIAAFGAAVTAVISLFVGTVCDRIGFNSGMVFGCLIRVAGVVLMAVATSFEAIYLGQLLFSIGGAFIRATEIPQILSLVDNEKHTQVAFNLSFCVFQFTVFFGNLSASHLANYFPGIFKQYEFSILLCAFIFLVMGIGRLFLPKPKDFAPSGKVSLHLHLFRNGRTLSFLTFGLLGGIGANLILPLSMINTIYRDSFKLNDSTIGLVYSLSTLVSCIAFFLAPLILNRWQNSKVALSVLSLNIVFFLFMTHSNIFVFVLMWLGFSFFQSVLPGAVENPMIQTIPQYDRGSYSGLVIFSSSIGAGIGSNLSGLFLTYNSYSGLMLIGAATMALQLLVYRLWCVRYLFDPNKLIIGKLQEN